MDERELDTKALAVAALVGALSVIQATKTETDELFESDIFSIQAPRAGDRFTSNKESIVDSKTLPIKVKKCMKVLQSAETSAEGKIKITEFLCNKLCDIYRIPIDKREIIIDELTKVVFNSEHMPVPLRLLYLKFRNETVPYHVSVKLYHDGVKDKMRVVPYFQILKYILSANVDLRKEEHCQQVLNEFEQLFNDQDVSLYTKMEIADIFLLNNRTERGHQMLDTLRELEFRLTYNPNDVNNAALYDRMLTIYGDSQNVHGSDLNVSALKACVHLMELESPNGFDESKIRDTLHRISPEHRKHIDTVLERIQIDTSRFRSGDNSFGLHEVFSSLLVYINKHPSREELFKRLIEEMVSMSKYCTTGHVSRFINVIQGYTDDEKLSVRISDEQQIRAIVGHYLDTVMMNTTEDVREAMIGDNQTPFYEFIQKRMNERIPQLFEEYGEIQEHIINAVKAYSRWDYWSILDTTLKCDKRPSPDLQVSDVCIEIYPCVHDCELDGKKFQWNGLKIHAWYVENGKPVPEHFAEYTANWMSGGWGGIEIPLNSESKRELEGSKEAEEVEEVEVTNSAVVETQSTWKKLRNFCCIM